MIEREVLGCLLKDNTLIQETIIQTDQFESQAHQLLFQSMKKLSLENKAVDKVTLLSDNYEYLQQMGGVDFITSLESQGSIHNFDTYERQLIEQYKIRKATKITQNWLTENEKDTENLVTNLQKLDELDLSEEKTKDEVLQDMFDLPFLENVEDVGIPTGLSDLDKVLGSFQNQNSYILGARPSMGKTAVMLKFMLSASQNEAMPIVFSLEMSKESLSRRLIATIGQINLFFARNPHNLTDSKKSAWQDAVNQLHKLDYEIFDKPMQTIQQMRSNVRKVQKTTNKQTIVMIDYLTLIHSTDTYQSDHSKFTDISARLKAIAKEYDCPVITLAQLSRGVEQRNDKRPMLSDLRESGSIEQDADAVLFLYRDSYYNKENDSDDLEIIVAKHRDGATGTATVYYNKSTGKMGDLSAY